MDVLLLALPSFPVPRSGGFNDGVGSLRGILDNRTGAPVQPRGLYGLSFFFSSERESAPLFGLVRELALNMFFGNSFLLYQFRSVCRLVPVPSGTLFIFFIIYLGWLQDLENDCSPFA
jgi:hypothetical protein